jgi:hypothetical protein
LSPIRKGAIVEVTSKDYGIVFEAEVLGLQESRSNDCCDYFLLRWRKLISLSTKEKEHAYKGVTKNFVQAFPVDPQFETHKLKLKKNGKGVRLVRSREIAKHEAWME